MMKGRKLMFAGEKGRKFIEKPAEFKTPYLKMLGVTENQTAFKFEFNTAARDLFLSTNYSEENSKIAVLNDFDYPKEFFLTMNEKYSTDSKAIRLNKNNTFTTKYAYLAIKEAYNIPKDKDAYFILEKVTIDRLDFVTIKESSLEELEKLEESKDSHNSEIGYTAVNPKEEDLGEKSEERVNEEEVSNKSVEIIENI